jgi:predicted PurR-regulated permease PerM
VGVCQIGLFVLVLGYTLHEIKSVLLPVVLAVLVSMVLYPVYLTFRKMWLPRFLSAVLTVSGLIAILVFGGYQAVIPGVEWARNMDEANVLKKVQEVFQPMQKVQKELSTMAEKVGAATSESSDSEDESNGSVDGDDGAETASVPGISAKEPEEPEEAEKAEPVQKAKQPKPVKVEIHEDPVGAWITETREFGVALVAFLLLVLFILAYGNQIVDQFKKNPNVEGLPSRIATEISRYLSTVTIVNACLGVFVGAAMWGLGMPKPVLWGVMAMIFNFIPYIGALIGTMVIFLAAVVNFEQPGMVMTVPLVYFLLTAIEGNLITPTVLGERFRINPLVVFLWIFAWGGFWGVAGILIAMPTLVTFKIICEHTDKLAVFRRLMNA